MLVEIHEDKYNCDVQLIAQPRSGEDLVSGEKNLGKVIEGIDYEAISRMYIEEEWVR